MCLGGNGDLGGIGTCASIIRARLCSSTALADSMRPCIKSKYTLPGGGKRFNLLFGRALLNEQVVSTTGRALRVSKGAQPAQICFPRSIVRIAIGQRYKGLRRQSFCAGEASVVD